MSKEWVPLHLHTVFSNFDGTIGIPSLVKWAEGKGVSAAAVTDHGIMSAVPSFYKATEYSSVKPIFGCELYIDPILPNPDGLRPAHHLIALAANERGYRNLMKLLSFGHKENFYMKPRVTIEKVEQYSEGIIFSSACIAGELPSLLLRKDFDGAKKFLSIMQSACKNNFYIELMDTGDRDFRQMSMNESLYSLARNTGTRMIFTCDAHYFPGDEAWYPHILAVNKGKTLEEMKAASAKTAAEYDDNDVSMYDLSLRSPENMWERWGAKYGEALAGTTYVASLVERYKIIPDSYYMPSIDEPGRKPLVELARDGLANRLSSLAGDRPAGDSVYRDRLEYELSMVSQMGFNDYFLMVHEMVDWAKNSGIFVGPGRGSAAGSILAWSLGITSVDPIRHNLFFERFLNPERISMPDIDVDFEDARRGEVIQHLKDRYGENAVSGIIGYSEAKWKSSLRDAARTLGYGAGDGDLGGMFASASKEFLDVEAFDGPVGREPEAPSRLVEAAVQKNGRLADKRPDMMKIATLAQKFLSLVRHYTRHASGIVIAPPEVTDHCPLYNLKGKGAGELVVQYDMDGVETVKLVKMDILGLSNLTLMKEIYNTSKKFDPSTPSPDMLYAFLDSSGEDMTALCVPGTPFYGHISKESVEHSISILGEGSTTGIFQLFSPGMRKLLRNIKPKDIDALSALIALYRPGPLASGMTKSYEETCKGGGQGEISASPFSGNVNALVADVTRDSKGLVIYQEQVMKVAQVLGGYSLGEADMLRRAMGKKKADVMAAEKGNFVKKCVANGLDENDAAETFDTLAHFAGYGFNKSHSTAYAYVAFATAWYKANREPVFWGAFLDLKNAHEKKEEMVPYIRECMKKWQVHSPTLLEGDTSLEDSAHCRVIRSGKRLGEMFPDFNDIAKANSLLWMEPRYWSIFLGATMLGGISDNKVDSIDDVGNHPDFLSLIRHLILDAGGQKMNPKTVAQLALVGVFDRLLAGIPSYSLPLAPDEDAVCVAHESHENHGDELPSGGEAGTSVQGMLFGDEQVLDRMAPRKRKGNEKKKVSASDVFSGFIKEDFSSVDKVPVPVLRSMLIFLEEEMENDPKLRSYIEDSIVRIVKKGTDIVERLKNTDRNRFLAWISLVVARIRAKTSTTRNPWGEREVELALVPVARAFRYMAFKASCMERQTFSDSAVRLNVLRSLYRRDAIEFSEGLSVPSWVLASEITGWTMSGYVDELDAFMHGNRDDQFSNSPWGKEMSGNGLWFIGYAERIIVKNGEKSLLLSGRWGNSMKNHFVSLPGNVSIPKFNAGDCVAIRLKSVKRGDFGWWGWEVRDMKIISLMSPEGAEKIHPLNGGRDNRYAIIRFFDGLAPEASKLMGEYLKKIYRETHQGVKGVYVVKTPMEITDVTRIKFYSVSLAESTRQPDKGSDEKTAAGVGENNDRAVLTEQAAGLGFRNCKFYNVQGACLDRIYGLPVPLFNV